MFADDLVSYFDEAFGSLSASVNGLYDELKSTYDLKTKLVKDYMLALKNDLIYYYHCEIPKNIFKRQIVEGKYFD